jgi:two-component system, NtrC family, response regulator AtoC
MAFPKPLIIGRSRAILKILELARKVSDVDFNVLITGESGVGKELVARSLHYYSSRSEKPFVKVNSANLPAELVESELFGYERGAFTGADRRRTGKFEQAEDGSLFLDEIGELPLQLQAKLLQVLQDRCYYRIGGQKEIQVRARVIAATNQNLDRQIGTGTFRNDLFYRLSTISIHIPPLRERKEDIPDLVEYFLNKISINQNRPKITIPQSLIDIFLEYHWPGNIRELENYLHRLSILENFRELEEEIMAGSPKKEASQLHAEVSADHAEHVKPLPADDVESFPSLKEVRDEAVKKVEQEVIEKVLLKCNWNRKETAKILKISYRALLYKIKDLDLSPPRRK